MLSFDSLRIFLPHIRTFSLQRVEFSIANSLLFEIPFDNSLKWSKHHYVYTTFHIQTVWFLLALFVFGSFHFRGFLLSSVLFFYFKARIMCEQLRKKRAKASLLLPLTAPFPPFSSFHSYQFALYIALLDIIFTQQKTKEHGLPLHILFHFSVIHCVEYKPHGNVIMP